MALCRSTIERKTPRRMELTPIFGDGLKDQAAAWA
jgi:hypothetical protein